MLNIIFKHKIQKSLRHKLLMPLILVGFILTIGVMVFAYNRFQELLVEKLGVRAELLANTVNYSAESLLHDGELQRVVMALSSEKEVNLILVVDNWQQEKIIAATRTDFLNKTIEQTINEQVDVKKHIHDALYSHEKITHLDTHSRTYEIVQPLRINQIHTSQSPQLINAVVFVQLDIKPTERDALKTVTEFIGVFLSVFLILLFYSYGLLRHYVVTPITEIIQQIANKQEIAVKQNKIKDYDEINLLGDTLHETFVQIEKTHDALKQQQKDLRESEFRWKFAVEGSGDGLWDWNIKSDTVFFSHCWKEMLGFEDDEIGNSLAEWKERIHLDDQKEVFQIIKDYLDGKTSSYICEHRVICKDGTHKWILNRGVIVDWDEKRNPLRMIGTYSDISRHKEMEEQLKASENQLRTIIDVLPVPLAINDNKPDIVFINRTFVETFGYDINDIPTLEHWWEAAYPDLAYRQWVIKTWLESLVKMQRDNAPFVPIELVIRCKNGGVKNVLVSAVQMLEDVNVVVLCDITEHKKIELELAESNANLEQFAYAVSHDMRQPLRMVTSYLTLIENALKNQLDDDTRLFLHFAVDGAKRMDSMILSLLDYSRIGRTTKVLKRVSSENAVNEALQFLEPELKNSGGIVEIAGDWIELMANEDELTRLLQNLIGNALKYHQENQPPKVKILATVMQNMFRVEISDSGIGIEPAQTERLFKVFSRLYSHSRFEGTGIGLALCRKIVEHHGGKIGVISQGEGLGSMFWFEIPIIK